MAATRTACPPVGDLERLLAEDLAGPERDGVEAHVEACSSCQERLARLSGPAFGPAAAGSGGTGSDPEPGEHFLRRLRELSPPTADTDSHRPLPAPDAARFPDRRLGRYEILERLAAGGMGTVYRARHVELDKVVALKVLPIADLTEVGLARFKNEMRAIGRLHHPNIVAAHDAGEADGVHYLAMDLVDGIDLGRLAARHGRLPVPEACAAIRQAALGLQHAFEKGLVHRDVKPSNLMLAADGTVKLLDLGLARVAEDAPADRLTAKGVLLGTTDYLAPEQWEHPHAADVRADVYSLGCTLYHLLAGRPPFAGDGRSTVLSRLRAHQDEPPPPIARPDVPPALAAVVGRMLAKVPARRFQTPADVAAALEPFAAGADLVRLLDATEIAPLPADAAVTPGPAARQTAVGSTRMRLAPARRYTLPVAAAAVALVLLPTLYLWPGGAGQSDPRPNPPPVTELKVTQFKVTAYRDDGKTELGDLETSAGQIRSGDSVTVTAELSPPAHYYLIALNPPETKEGLEQLCLPADAKGEGARTVRPERQAKARYPGDDGAFRVDSAGLQVFVLAASIRPLPTYDAWRETARDLPWTGVKAGGEFGWHFDGTAFQKIPRKRGEVVGTPPKPLSDLRDWFKARPEFEAVQIIAFPVAEKK